MVPLHIVPSYHQGDTIFCLNLDNLWCGRIFRDFDFFFDVSKKAAIFDFFRRVWGVEGEGRSGMQILVADRKIDRL